MQILTIIAILGFITIATAGYPYIGNGYNVVTQHAAPLAYAPIGGYYGKGYYNHDAYQNHYSYPKYSFNYGVKDAHTGDNKDQWESRDGDRVNGGYSLDEADGTKRVVEYYADGHNGFNAVVKKIGHAYHPQTYHNYGHGDLYRNTYGGHGPYHGGYASSYANIKQYHH